LTKSGVAIEKLTQQKMDDKTSHWEALQTTFSVWADIFYPQFFIFGGKWTFSTATGVCTQNPH
jgi:hypothetical protein